MSLSDLSNTVFLDSILSTVLLTFRRLLCTSQYQVDENHQSSNLHAHTLHRKIQVIFSSSCFLHRNFDNRVSGLSWTLFRPTTAKTLFSLFSLPLRREHRQLWDIVARIVMLIVGYHWRIISSAKTISFWTKNSRRWCAEEKTYSCLWNYQTHCLRQCPDLSVHWRSV